MASLKRITWSYNGSPWTKDTSSKILEANFMYSLQSMTRSRFFIYDLRVWIHDRILVNVIAEQEPVVGKFSMKMSTTWANDCQRNQSSLPSSLSWMCSWKFTLTGNIFSFLRIQSSVLSFMLSLKDFIYLIESNHVFKGFMYNTLESKVFLGFISCLLFWSKTKDFCRRKQTNRIERDKQTDIEGQSFH